MHRIARVAAVAFVLLFSATPLLAQRGTGDSGGSHNGGDSGGESPFGGNPFREDEQRQQLLPEGASDRTVGMQALQNRDYPLAVTHLTIALAKTPNDAKLNFFVGYSHHMLGQAQHGDLRASEFKLARDYYGKARDLDPGDRVTHQYLGVLSLQLRDQPAAGSEQQALVTLCPSGCDELTKLSKAITDYRAAMSSAPAGP